MFSLWLRVKLLWSLRNFATRVVRLFLDRRVPPSLKILTALGALLIVSPVDVLGDIPILGVFDDAALLVLLAMLFVRFCPPEAVAEHSDATTGRKLKNVTPN